MNTYLECLPCFLRQAVEAAKLATDDPRKRWEAVEAVLRILNVVSAYDRPPQVAARVHRAVRDITRNDDPYCQVKREGNEAAMDFYPRAKELTAASADPLETAAKFAVIGNIIDSGVGLRFDLEAEIESANEKHFASGDFELLREELENASNLLYLADNAGEIVFDRLLLEQMKGKTVFLAVKSEPMLNDALLADAEIARIDHLASLLTTGSGWPGTGVSNCSAEFQEAFARADVIIAKGQGNFEWLSEEKANIFFLLMAKCPVVARELGVEVGSLVVKCKRRN